MEFRCSVKSCTKTIADQVIFFNVKKVANYGQFSNDLIESKTQKICSDHFEFKHLSRRLKKGGLRNKLEVNTLGAPKGTLLNK